MRNLWGFPQIPTFFRIFAKKMKQSIRPYLATSVSLKYMGVERNSDEIDEAMRLIGNYYTNSILDFLNFKLSLTYLIHIGMI